MTYNPTQRPRHPVVVAYLSDAALLVRAADQLEIEIDGTATAPGRKALSNAATILRGAANALRN